MFQRMISFYKLLNLVKRIGLIFAFATLVVGFLYFDNIPDLEELLASEQSSRDIVLRKLADAQQRARQLPQVEAEIAHLQERIEVGKKPLPTTVSIDQILRETAEIAQKTGVALTKFSPGEATLSATPFQYFQIPIRIELGGSYTHLAIFLDRLVHLPILLHVQNITLKLPAGSPVSADKGDATAPRKKTLVALKNQEQLLATAEILAFRSANTEEITVAEVDEGKKGGNKK